MRWTGRVAVTVGSSRLLCTGVDLSADGIALTGGWSIYAGRELEMEFTLFGQVIRAQGIVVWSRLGKGAHWGVRFRDISAEDRERVAAFVASRRCRAGLRPTLHIAPLPPPPLFAGYGAVTIDPTIRMSA